MNKENPLGLPLVDPNYPDNQAANWDTFQRMFGKLGEPGYAETEKPLQAKHLFFHDEVVNVVWNTLRGEDGLLLCVHGTYIDKNGIRKELLFFVNPNHQRQGIGTQMINYLLAKYAEEVGDDYVIGEHFMPNTPISPPLANWITKTFK